MKLPRSATSPTCDARDLLADALVHVVPERARGCRRAMRPSTSGPGTRTPPRTSAVATRPRLGRVVHDDEVLAAGLADDAGVAAIARDLARRPRARCCWKTSVEPVKWRPAKSGWARHAPEIAAASPGTRLITPSGRPAACNRRIVRCAETTAVLAGFQTTVLPMSAGAEGGSPPIAVKLNGADREDEAVERPQLEAVPDPAGSRSAAAPASSLANCGLKRKKSMTSQAASISACCTVFDWPSMVAAFRSARHGPASRSAARRKTAARCSSVQLGPLGARGERGVDRLPRLVGARGVPACAARARARAALAPRAARRSSRPVRRSPVRARARSRAGTRSQRGSRRVRACPGRSS